MSGAMLAGAWLSAALLAAAPDGPADGPLAAPDAGATVSRVLGQDRYLFCAEGNAFTPGPDDLRWCELAAADPAAHARCPGYAEVCARGLAAAGELPDLDGQLGSGQDQERRPGDANRGAYEESDPWELPDLGVFAEILMWALLIGGVIALAVIIVKNMVRGRDPDAPEVEVEPEPDAGPEDRLAAQRAVETDVQRLLARAEQAAQRGQFEAAIADVYAALLRRLEGERLIVVERFKTNGDYLGELRSKPPLRDEVRAIVWEVEQVQFGAAAAQVQADGARYASVRARVLAVLGRAALTVAGLLTGGAVVGSLLGCPRLHPLTDPEALPDSGALAGLRTGPADHRAVGELLLVHGIDARHRTRSIEQLASSDAAIVLLAGVRLLDEDWDTLQRWIEDEGGTLIIATGEEFPRELRVSYQLAEDDAGLLRASPTNFFFDQLEIAAPDGRTLDANDLALAGEVLAVREHPIEIGDRPYLLRRSIGEHGGQIVVFAEPDLLTNVGISVSDNAALLVNLLRSLGIDEVEFVDEYTGAGADDPFESVANAELGALFLQILLFLGLLYAAVGIPFARLREPDRQRRRAFVEHVQTLGQRYAQARASRYVAGLYSGWALDRLRERVRVGGASGLLPLAQAIAARTGRDEAAVMRLLVEAHDLREGFQQSTGSSAAGRAADLELMRQLAALLDEI